MSQRGLPFSAKDKVLLCSEEAAVGPAVTKKREKKSPAGFQEMPTYAAKPALHARIYRHYDH